MKTKDFIYILKYYQISYTRKNDVIGITQSGSALSPLDVPYAFQKLLDVLGMVLPYSERLIDSNDLSDLATC